MSAYESRNIDRSVSSVDLTGKVSDNVACLSVEKEETGALDISGEDCLMQKIAVLCIGNKLMLDDGLGTAVFEELQKRYCFPENVELFDVGCLSLDMLPLVDSHDVIITVDAVDGTDVAPGTVFRFEPDAMARRSGATASLHDLKLVDLFDAAALLGYRAKGLCLGMQIENGSPSVVTIGLTPQVYEALPLLVETVVGEIARLGYPPSLCKENSYEREYVSSQKSNV